MFRPAGLLLLVCVLLAGCAAPAAAPDEPAPAAPAKLVLLTQPRANVDETNLTLLEHYLNARLARAGMPADVSIVVPPSYDAAIAALDSGAATAAFMSAWPAVEAVRQGAGEVALAEVREVIHGTETVAAPFYYSYYIVRADSPYTKLEDLRGARVAYPGTSSTSGYVFPVARLAELGLIPKGTPQASADPAAFFGEVLIAGSYGAAYEALRDGRADVAVTAGDIKASLYHEILANVRVIEQQGPVPSHAVVMSAAAPPAERDALKAALLDLHENRDLMRNFVSGIFLSFEETTSTTHLRGLSDALGATALRWETK